MVKYSIAILCLLTFGKVHCQTPIFDWNDSGKHQFSSLIRIDSNTIITIEKAILSGESFLYKHKYNEETGELESKLLNEANSTDAALFDNLDFFTAKEKLYSFQASLGSGKVTLSERSMNDFSTIGESEALHDFSPIQMGSEFKLFSNDDFFGVLKINSDPYRPKLIYVEAAVFSKETLTKIYDKRLTIPRYDGLPILTKILFAENGTFYLGGNILKSEGYDADNFQVSSSTPYRITTHVFVAEIKSEYSIVHTKEWKNSHFIKGDFIMKKGECYFESMRFEGLSNEVALTSFTINNRKLIQLDEIKIPLLSLVGDERIEGAAKFKKNAAKSVKGAYFTREINLHTKDDEDNSIGLFNFAGVFTGTGNIIAGISYKIDNKGKIVTYSRLPLLGIVVSAFLDESNKLHVLMNDQAFRYDQEGQFIGLIKRGVNSTNYPVHVMINLEDCSVVKREQITQGFGPMEMFEDVEIIGRGSNNSYLRDHDSNDFLGDRIGQDAILIGKKYQQGKIRTAEEYKPVTIGIVKITSK
jgi:hypothetical protein